MQPSANPSPQQQQEVVEGGQLVPLPPRPSDLVAEWLGDGQPESGAIRTNLDLTGRSGVALMSRLLLDSAHDNFQMDGKEFTITGAMITAGRSYDTTTGEVKIWPRTAIPCLDGTHLVFNGIVAFRSVLALIVQLKPEEWKAGIKVRIHAKKSKPGGLMHRLEVLS